MNIWGLQKQIKKLIIYKKEYLKRSKKQIDPKVVKNFDQSISMRKDKIRELRKNKPKIKKKR